MSETIMSDGRPFSEHMKDANEFAYPEKFVSMKIPRTFKDGISEEDFQKFADGLFGNLWSMGNKPDTAFAARTVYINFFGQFTDGELSAEWLNYEGNDAEAIKRCFPDDELVSTWINGFALGTKKTNRELAEDLFRQIREANSPAPERYLDLLPEMKNYFDTVFFREADGCFRMRTKYYFS